MLAVVHTRAGHHAARPSPAHTGRGKRARPSPPGHRGPSPPSSKLTCRRTPALASSAAGAAHPLLPAATNPPASRPPPARTTAPERSCRPAPPGRSALPPPWPAAPGARVPSGRPARAPPTCRPRRRRSRSRSAPAGRRPPGAARGSGPAPPGRPPTPPPPRPTCAPPSPARRQRTAACLASSVAPATDRRARDPRAPRCLGRPDLLGQPQRLGPEGRVIELWSGASRECPRRMDGGDLLEHVKRQLGTGEKRPSSHNREESRPWQSSARRRHGSGLAPARRAGPGACPRANRRRCWPGQSWLKALQWLQPPRPPLEALRRAREPFARGSRRLKIGS